MLCSPNKHTFSHFKLLNYVTNVLYCSLELTLHKGGLLWEAHFLENYQHLWK